MRFRYAVMSSLLIAGAAAAEESTTAVTARTSKTIALDGGIAVPTGDMADAAGFGIGALVRFEMPLRDKLVLTARAGYIQHLEKEAEGGLGGEAKSSWSQLPLIGGVRYAFSPKFYGAAELGLVMVRVSVDIGGESMDSSDTNLGMTLGGGYRTGKLDVRGGLLFPDAGEAGDVMAVMATVGYDLTAL
jgi:hypothetical protein